MSSFRQHFRNLIIIAADQDWPEYAGDKLHLSAENISGYRQYLGEQYHCVFFSAATSFHADALLAVCGTLAGGGLLVLKAPQQPTPAWERLLYFLNQPTATTQQPIKNAAASMASLPTELANKAAAQAACDALRVRLAEEVPNPAADALEPTAEQATALQQIQQLHERSAANASTHSNSNQHSAAVVINAPRGRGKSTLLGLWIHQQPTASFVVCAPSKRQAERILSSAQQPITFVPPDQLLDYQPTPSQWLFIDEAASLPSHVLHTVAERWSNLALATTTEGYESAGRGFLLRFQQQLPNYFREVLQIQLQQPVRWQAGDPLEHALNQCFCLQEENTTPSEPTSSAPVEYIHCHAQELSHETLGSAFALLTAAHYQTSPNDLRLLLDDSAQQLTLQYQNGTLIGVFWVAHEGPLPDSLVEPIYQGKRRPPGNLLPQTLVFHLREKVAATLPMQRIVRIAIAPSKQGRGFGTRLLHEVLESAESSQTALVGTSFGGSESLHTFWHRSGFQPVRLGLQKDAASGLRSLVYLKSSGNAANAALMQAKLTAQFANTLPGYAAAAPAIMQELPWLFTWGHQQPRYATQQLPIARYLADFAAGYIPFAVLQPVLAAVVLNNETAQSDLPIYDSPSNYAPLLTQAAISAVPFSQFAKSQGYSGKAALEAELKRMASQLNLR